METELIKINSIDDEALKRAGQCIKDGGLVAFPTETVYGLGGDGLNEVAAKNIYLAKGRPSDNPLILHINDQKMLGRIVSEVTPMAKKIMTAFCPGPITIILPKSNIVPKAVTINKWMFIYASMCYIPFSYYDISTIQWTSISTVAILQVLYVVLGGSFLAYLCIMTAQRLLRPTVVSMYNYMQPIVATIAAIAMGIGSFGWEKGIAIALVFLGVYIVTQSKSRADLEKAEKPH